ncbi:hypothetical protein N7512_009936 [Penicillium capsulatum]|nr:hypothetical protein N7512_009936 [Penicillium capsulatum]
MSIPRRNLPAGKRIIVKRKLNSALLLEDDADWDISIKAQLQNFARATRALQRTPLNFTESPYGHDWDLLWLGHCGLACQHDQPHYTTPNDPTVVTPDGLPYYHHGVDDYNRPDHTRLVCTVANAACTFSYALSYRGAQKILAALSVNPSGIIDQVNTNDQIDIVLGRMCKSNFLRCYGAFPGIIGGYMSAGLSSKGTDQSGKDANAHMAPATSQGIMYSTMLNIKRILRGERTVEATSPDAAAPSIIPGEIQIERGQLQEPIGSNRKPDSEPEPEPGPEVESEIE